MNGRIYDPKLGRFLQADPIVQFPHYSQSWNTWGISAAAFSAIGQHFSAVTGLAEGGLGHILTHGLAGGILAELQGGQFGHGFLAAGLSKAVMGRFSYADGSAPAVLNRTTIAAVVGGTISRITGGKFANGALTSAMAQLFNNEMSNAQKKEMNSTTDKQGNTIYTRGDGKVVVVEGVIVKSTDDGNTVSDILTVSENLDKTVYVISGYRSDNKTSEHYGVAADIYVAGATPDTTPTFRDQIHKLNIFNRVTSYHNRNTIHVDYKSTANQGRFHDAGEGWIHMK